MYPSDLISMLQEESLFRSKIRFDYTFKSSYELFYQISNKNRTAHVIQAWVKLVLAKSPNVLNHSDKSKEHNKALIYHQKL